MSKRIPDSYFSYMDRESYLKGRRLWSPQIRHRYIGCAPPFDPAHSALAALFKRGNGLRLSLGWLIAEYETSLAGGRADVWKRAAVSTVDLFSTMHT